VQTAFSQSGRPQRKRTLPDSASSLYVSSELIGEEVDRDGWEVYSEADFGDDNNGAYFIDGSNEALIEADSNVDDFCESEDEDFVDDKSQKIKNKKIIGTGGKLQQPPRKRKRKTFSSYDHKANKRAQALDTTVDPLAEKMATWIVKYFDRKSSYIPPIYFQHEGHSRTIVGYEKLFTGKINLIIFDPLTNGKALLKTLEDYANGNVFANGWKRQVKRGLHTLKRGAYEMLIIKPGLMGPSERMRSKELDSYPAEADIESFD
jgi:hypothetical protein